MHVGVTLVDDCSIFSYLPIRYSIEFYRLFPTQKKNKLRSLQREVDDMILEKVRDRLVDMQRDDAPRKDLLQAILKRGYSTEYRETDKLSWKLLRVCTS